MPRTGPAAVPSTNTQAKVATPRRLGGQVDAERHRHGQQHRGLRDAAITTMPILPRKYDTGGIGVPEPLSAASSRSSAIEMARSGS